MDDLGDRRKAVGGARSVGDHIQISLVVEMVDSKHEERSIVLGWCRDNNLLGSTLEMQRGSLSGKELSSGFTDSGDTMLSPRNLGGIGFRVESDLLTVDEHSVFPKFHMMWESEMCGVIGEEILEVFGIHEGIVDHCHIDPSWDLEGGSEDESADTAKSIDSKHF